MRCVGDVDWVEDGADDEEVPEAQHDGEGGEQRAVPEEVEPVLLDEAEALLHILALPRPRHLEAVVTV